MAIDTNLGITYNEGFPVAGVDQSSQGFRDNFTALKRAIENLQGMSSTAGSILTVTPSIGTGGAITVSLAYRDNALRLPTGSPTVTPQAGMLRHTNGVLEIHDGGGWQTMLSTESMGGVRIPGASYLKLPAGFNSDRPPVPEDGMIRYNETLATVEVFSLGAWTVVGSDANGSLNSSGGVISGVLDLLTDATLPTEAVNFRTMKNYATNMFQSRPTGISAVLNQVTNAVTLTAMPFTIQLTGEVIGNGIVTDLNDVQIAATIPNQLTPQQVRDTVGSLVKGTISDPNANTITESGITVTYDSVNQTLELGVREFNVNLTGVVTGTAHSARLQDINILTSTTSLIEGVTAYDEGRILGATQSVQNFNFSGGGISAVQTGNTVNVTVQAGLTVQDVRDTVGAFVQGTIRNPQTNAVSESGIYVYYDSANQTLELYPRDFTITLTGGVQGSGIVSRLNNVTIDTTSDYIAGVQVLDESVALAGPETVRVFNFIGNSITATQANDTVTVTVADPISDQGVRDLVGNFISGTVRDISSNAVSESGIYVYYDAPNQTLEIYPRDFTITLAGAVWGNAIVSRLNNVTITTDTDLIRGIIVEEEGVALGLPESVTTLNFTGGGASASQAGNAVTVNVPVGLQTADVQDIVGSFVSGTVFDQQANATTESGIFVNYDKVNHDLQIYPRDFTITLGGAVRGSATVSRLNNVSITTDTDLISGIMVEGQGVPLGLPQSATILNFTGDVTLNQSANVVTIDVPQGLQTSDVQNIVGSFVSGTIIDPTTLQSTESGISVYYDKTNHILELAPRDFTITLAGAVRGNGTVSHLNNVTITTDTDLIKGIMVEGQGLPLGLPESVTTLNFTGAGLSTIQNGTTVTVDVPVGLQAPDVRNIVGSFVSGNITDASKFKDTESGILVYYDVTNQLLELAPRDFTINLTGAVSGNATVSRLSNVTITTLTSSLIEGITVEDEGTALGLPQSVTTLNFTGGGITSTQNGSTVMVNVPPDMTATDVQNIVGAFVSGTNGILVNYDSRNETLTISPKDFNVTLAGAVTGSATISHLNDVTINTATTTLIQGIMVENQGTPLGTQQSVTTLNFIGGGVSSTQSGNAVTVNVPVGLQTIDVQNIVGSFVSGTVRDVNTNAVSESGIFVYYDTPNHTLEIYPRDFTITLAGPITGNATVSRLSNVTINTATTSLIQGIMVENQGTPLGLSQSVTTLNFAGGVTSTQSGNAVTVNVPVGLTSTDVKNIVGPFVTGSNGITSYYDSKNETLQLSPQDFTITLSGDISGSGTVSHLGNVTINATSTDLLKGLLVENQGVALGLPQSVTALNFIGGGVSSSQTGNTVTVNVPLGMQTSDVQNIVGAMVSGTSGIISTYDSHNQTLQISPQDFTISLAGVITGNATVSHLGNVTINTTTSNLIQGLMVEDEGTALGLPQSVTVLNFVGGGVSSSQTGNAVTVSVPLGMQTTDVQNIVGSFVSGTVFDPQANATTESGIFVSYDRANQALRIYPRDFTITLSGDIIGNATVSRLGNVTINTTTPDLIRGVTVEDEGVALGLPQSVTTFNFTGGAVSSTQSGNTVTVSVPQGLQTTDVQNIVGSFISGTVFDPQANATTESGIFTYYDTHNQTLEVYPRDFTITLAGEITGNATVSRLGNVTIQTSTPNLIQGVNVEDEGVTLGLPQSVTTFNFTGGGVTSTQAGNTVTVSVPLGMQTSDVQNIVGALVTGSNGIVSYYDAQNHTLQISPQDFTVTLTGDVTGSGIVSRLGNVTISTVTDAITGLTVQNQGQALGAANAIQTVNFTGGGVTALQNGNLLTVNVPTPLGQSDIRNTVGTFIQGSVRDPQTQVSTESGINVYYDTANNALLLSPRDFTISLVGAVTGSGTVSRLNNVAITTTADFLQGITVETSGTLLGTTVKTFNFVGANASVSANTATIQFNASVSPSDIIPTVQNLLVGTQHVGLTAAYDSTNSQIDLALKPLTINLLGAVIGNGTVTYGSDSSTVTIGTSMNDVGITVQDEGATGGTVSTVNFVGAGVTSAVSIDGHTATVYIPNSPGNENFVLIDYGSANTPNARKLTAGTGIIFNDGGPGGDFTVSAESDAIIARSRYLQDGALVGERPTINIVSTNDIVVDIQDDGPDNQINLSIYSLATGWYLSNSIDCGFISDKYGPSIDIGSMSVGIIEVSADMGTLQG